MLRVFLALIVATYLISIPITQSLHPIYGYGNLFGLVFIFAFIPSLIFGILTLVIFRSVNWNKWWQVVIAGVLASQIASTLCSDSTYDFVLFFGFGVAIGLMVWLIGMLQNPLFMSADEKIPKSLLLVPFGVALLAVYTNALKPEDVYGCITNYELAPNPTTTHHSNITVIADSGETFQGGVREKQSNPGIVGTCALGEIRRTASLQSYHYNLYFAKAGNCVQVCGDLDK